jgi:hypothetical protein
MPIQKLALRPGVNRESTSYANEGGYYASNKIRFRSGQVEKIGGWTADTGTTTSTLKPTTGKLWGVARSMWNWLNLAGYNLLAIGTNLKYYIQSGANGLLYDITPIRSTTTAGEVTFAASNGSYNITVTDAGHGAQTGDFVTFSGAIALSTQTYTATAATDLISFTTALSNGTTLQLFTTGTAPAGLSTGTTYYVVNSNTPTASCKLSLTSGGAAIDITGAGTGTQTFALTTGMTASVLNAEFQITYVSSNSYTIQSSVAATASDTGTGGASVVGAYQITTGQDIYSQNVGWGAGTWGGIITGAVTTAVSGGTLSSSNTTVTVTSTTGFTTTGRILIDSETISYTGVTGTTFTGCTRGLSGAGSGAATTHANGASVVQSTSFIGWGQSATVGVGVQLRLWSQSSFGEDLIFNPRGGALYYWANSATANTFNRGVYLGPSQSIVTKAGTITTDAYCPSVANFVLVSDASRFVIAFGVNDSVAGSTIQDPLLIYWSNQESFAVWYPAVTNQAGSYRLSHGSQIVTAIQTRQEILVLTDAAIYSMQYLGPPYVWGFQIMEDNISIAGPNAIATANNITYWMGTDKFYMYSGRVQTLVSTLREYVYSNINLEQSYQFMAGTNEGYNEIWWQYCSAGSTVIDRYVIYNHVDNVWYYGDWNNYTGTAYQGRTAWLDSPLRAYPMAATYGVAGGSANTLLVYHENGVDDGTVNPSNPIASTVTSSDFDIGDGHNFGFVWRLIPDLSFDGSNVNQPSCLFTVLPRTFPGANYGSSNNPAVTSTQNYQGQQTYAIQQFTQQVYVRIRGRQMAFQVSSNTLGVQWQLGVPRIDIRPDGRR